MGDRRHFCVLDIETALSEAAAALVDRGTRSMSDRPALQELVAASVLRFDRIDGRFSDFRLESVVVGELREEDALERLDALMRPVYDAGGIAITFHGAFHDFPALRRRADRHWLFEAFRYPDWTGRHANRHVDLIRVCSAPGIKGWVSLVDACAAMGFAAGPSVRSTEGAALANPVCKSQIDVVAEALLFFYHLSSTEGRPEAVLEGWSSLSAYLRGPARREPHLDCFARHPYAALARRILDEAA